MQTVYMQSEQLKVSQAANQTSLKPAFYLIESTFIEKSLAGENQGEQLAVQGKLLFQFSVNCCALEQYQKQTFKLNIKEVWFFKKGQASEQKKKESLHTLLLYTTESQISHENHYRNKIYINYTSISSVICRSFLSCCTLLYAYLYAYLHNPDSFH